MEQEIQLVAEQSDLLVDRLGGPYACMQTGICADIHARTGCDRACSCIHLRQSRWLRAAAANMAGEDSGEPMLCASCRTASGPVSAARMHVWMEADVPPCTRTAHPAGQQVASPRYASAAGGCSTCSKISSISTTFCIDVRSVKVHDPSVSCYRLFLWQGLAVVLDAASAFAEIPLARSLAASILGIEVLRCSYIDRAVAAGGT